MGSCTSKPAKLVPIINPSQPELTKKKTSMLVTLEESQSLKNSQKSKTLNRAPSKGKIDQGSLIILPHKIQWEGEAPIKKQQGFEEKRASFESTSLLNIENLWKMGISVTCKKGLKGDSPNQDDYFVIINGKSLLLGVFDGHGPHGHDISNFVHKSLPKLIFSNINLLTNVEVAFKEAFSDCQDLLISQNEDPESLFDCVISGTTATIGYIYENKLYLAHVGDSRAVLAKQQEDLIVAVNLTTDHRPNLAKEQERITSCGGEIRRLSEESPFRIFSPGKDYPGLSMSRAFGDIMSRDFGVVSDPDLVCVELDPSDLFVLICSDGVWEFITSEEAVTLVYKCDGDAKKATEKLAALAWMRWKQKVDCVDDITVLVVYVKNVCTF